MERETIKLGRRKREVLKHTFKHNNGILNVNVLDDGLNAICLKPRGLHRRKRMIELSCWRCSDGTLSSTEDGGALVFKRRGWLLC